ncbi:MAG TPA: lactate racemase domain-containing protein [Acidobacteriota bacterium]|nr:lactate racemase domain-containing protein [Acidobacteriota bacterium]
MKYLTYSGNNLLNAHLPDQGQVFYPPPVMSGIPRKGIPQAVRRAFENPLGMEPLKDLVDGDSKVLIAFDDNCQPFPPMQRPDIRQICIETLLEMLYSYGVEKKNIQLRCAIALHRMMKRHELEYMLGKAIMGEFYPDQLKNFDAEDPDDIVELGQTDEGEPVETTRAVVDCDLVIYVDTIQIPLNGGHKSVAVGFGTYRSIAAHHHPKMTADSPHVMQPEGSQMHCSIRRISKVICEHAKIMVMEAPMNGALYPSHLRYLGKAPEHCNAAEKALKALTPVSMKVLPEPVRRGIFSSLKSVYSPLEINAGAIDDVHVRTLQALRPQLAVPNRKQFDTLVFGLPDLSPYAVGARINPVLVVSDVLGYVFNWFYGEPFIKPGGAVIILNPCFEVFHPEYHYAYERFYEEVLADTTEPFEMQRKYQEKYAHDPDFIDAYRNRWAHHGFHPFTVWYWATYPLKYLSKVILVGPPDDKAAKKLGVEWAPDLPSALAEAKTATGGEEVVGLTIPPFLYLDSNGQP